MKKEYDFNFLTELDNNNSWLLEKIKEEDLKTYLLMENAKKDVYVLCLAGLEDVASELVVRYRDLLIQAYPYYIALSMAS